MGVSALFGVNSSQKVTQVYLIMVYLGACGECIIWSVVVIVTASTPLEESSIYLEAKMKGKHNMRE